MKKKQGNGAGAAVAETVARPRLQLPALDWRRLIPVALAALLLSLSAFFFWQALQVWRDISARETLARYGGKLPDDAAALRSMRGIGRYTAGAILSFAYRRDAAVVDTNVRRVLGRPVGAEA